MLCGLNDFKCAHRGATSSAFHAKLVAEIRDICGPHTLVVLPALPLAATARFLVPLHWLVCALGARYDEHCAIAGCFAHGCLGVGVFPVSAQVGVYVAARFCGGG